MIVRSIYLGAFPIRQIYQNGKSIWSSGELIAILSNVEISTYGKATLALSKLFGLLGKSESNLNAMGIIHKFDLIKIKGDSENDTYGISLLTPVRAISIVSEAESNSDTDAFLRYFLVISMKSTIEETTEASGVASAFLAKHMVSEVEVNSDTEAVAYSVAFINLGAIKMPIKTCTSAKAYSYILLLAKGQAYSNTEALAETLHTFVALSIDGEGYCRTYADAELQDIPLHKLSGFGIVDTFGKAGVRTLSSESIDAIVEIISNAFGNGRQFSAISGNGKNESTNDGVGKLVLWYLPILEDNVLKIISAYDASVADGVLEVI